MDLDSEKAGTRKVAHAEEGGADAICLARQPILDCQGRVFAYELLYRARVDATNCTEEGDVASARVLANAVTALGLDVIAGGRPVFVNFTRDLLLNGCGTLLPPTSIVIEVREDVPIEGGVIESCRRLSEQGYALALDDFVGGSEAEVLMPYVTYVKVDVLETSSADRRAIAARLLPLGIRLVAEKVETAAIVAEATAAGYRLFQGHYFCRPTIVTASRIPENQITYLRLLGALSRPGLTIAELDDLVKHDVALSYRVLRSINSAAYGVRRRVSSIRQALVLLGLDHVRRWASVWVLAGLNASGTEEVLSLALLRARTCELLGDASGITADGSDLFLLGLCSVIDAIMGRPMVLVLEELPVSRSIKDALLGETNNVRPILDTVIAYEQGNWNEAGKAAARAGLSAHALPSAYADALRWAHELERDSAT